jgi:hypothetical protein
MWVLEHKGLAIIQEFRTLDLVGVLNEMMGLAAMLSRDDGWVLTWQSI